MASNIVKPETIKCIIFHSLVSETTPVSEWRGNIIISLEMTQQVSELFFFKYWEKLRFASGKRSFLGEASLSHT